MTMTNEYLLVSRVKNNLLLSAIRDAGYKTVAELSRACGVNNTAITGIINFGRTPVSTKTGDWLPIVHKICDKLNKTPDELFTEKQKHFIGAGVSKKEIAEDDILQTLESLSAYNTPELEYEAAQESDALRSGLHLLTDRQRIIVEERHGFNGREKTFSQIAKEIGMQGSRVQQVYWQAINRLRHRKEKFGIKPRLRDYTFNQQLAGE